jgi:putative hydrolase of the HAD superfamily
VTVDDLFASIKRDRAAFAAAAGRMDAQPGAIFFDLDGTILDWQTGMEESWLASCEAHCDGSYVPALLHEAIRARRTWFWDDPDRARTGRMDLDATSREIVRLAFADAGLHAIELAERIADDYRARRASLIVPYAGAIETLQAFRARGIPMALITNGEARNQRRSVEQHGLAVYFDCIVIEGEFGVGKPDERVFRHAMQSLSCAAEATWMVGNSLEADIAPAVALGMHAVWVDELGDGLPEGAPARPHRVVRSISELL